MYLSICVLSEIVLFTCVTSICCPVSHCVVTLCCLVLCPYKSVQNHFNPTESCPFLTPKNESNPTLSITLHVSSRASKKWNVNTLSNKTIQTNSKVGCIHQYLTQIVKLKMPNIQTKNRIQYLKPYLARY